MTHAIRSMAYVGQTPWHNLGVRLPEGMSIEEWTRLAGLAWDAIKRQVYYRTTVEGGDERGVPRAFVGQHVLARSDTGEPLGIVSDRYEPVQPREVMEFYRDLCESQGFTLETAGALHEGAKVWALAKTPEGLTLPGNDHVRGYLLLSTSYDGTAATCAKFTTIRVVCANTLAMAAREKAAAGGIVTVRHNTKFDATRCKIALGLHDAFGEFSDGARTLASSPVSQDRVIDLWMLAFHGKTAAEMNATDLTRKQGEKLIKTLVPALTRGPGAELDSARGTLWGAVNAVTFNVDHMARARSNDNRLDSAFFGKGNQIKINAWDIALKMARGEKVAV